MDFEYFWVYLYTYVITFSGIEAASAGEEHAESTPEVERPYTMAIPIYFYDKDRF